MIPSYLQVYKVLGPNLRLFALKVVTLKGCNSKEMVNGFKQEFDKLKSLKDSPGVINVHSLEEFPEDKMLLMCMEIGDIDLSNLLKKKRLEWEARGITDPFVADPTFICGLWHDMLRAVQVRVSSPGVPVDAYFSPFRATQTTTCPTKCGKFLWCLP